MTTLADRRSQQQAIYAALAAKGGPYGGTNHGKKAYRLVRRLRPGNIADFGCGQNKWKLGYFLSNLFYEDHQAISTTNVVGIDFAFPQADIRRPMHDTGLPDKWADVVVSFDALEHCLPEEVDEVIAEMRRVDKGPFVMSIGTRPSIAKGLNGEDLHPTLRPMAWWLDKLGGGARLEAGYIVGDWRQP